jgi:hypothetical protein
MKKVLATFITDKHSDDSGWLREFRIVEDTITKRKTIYCRVLYYGKDEIWRNYSIQKFETEWKINISELIW